MQEQEQPKLDSLTQLRAWFETNKKWVIPTSAAALAIGVVVYGYISYREATERGASEALLALTPSRSADGQMIPIAPDAYVRVASSHAGTLAASRALLLAGESYFDQGKFTEARTQFERFVSEYPESPFRVQALFGKASCLDALGKTPEALSAYKDLADRYPNDAAGRRAKLALIRLYQSQNKLEEAYRIAQELSKLEPGQSVGLLADLRIEELKLANPQLGAAPKTAPAVSPAPAITPAPAAVPAAKVKAP
jgi:tetratricopeptide (TPR) repeat protein